LAPWAKSARKAARFTQWRPAPAKQRGADPTGLGLKGSPARSSVKRVEWRSHSGPGANQRPCMGLAMSALAPSAAIVSAPRHTERGPAGNLSKSRKADFNHEIDRVFLVSAMAPELAPRRHVVIYDNECQRAGPGLDPRSAVFIG
jgi:hypothetical protein